MAGLVESFQGGGAVLQKLKARGIFVIRKLKDTNGNVVRDPTTMANIFNNFFVNVADDVKKRIPKSPRSPLKPQLIFFLIPSTAFEIYDIIGLLKTIKSVGPNSIPIKLLKILSIYISYPLSQIMNESFCTGIFPEKMQHAKVVPLLKKGCPVTAPSYLFLVKFQRY